MASWAWRSLAAETIFMALVICCVLLTLRIRRRMSMRAGMGASLSRPLRLARRLEDGRELGEGRLQLLGELALDFLLLRDRREEGAVAAVEPGEALLLVAPAVGDGERVEGPRRGREADRD